MEPTGLQTSLRANLNTVTRLSDEILTLLSRVKDLSEEQKGLSVNIRYAIELLLPLSDGVTRSPDAAQWSEIYGPLLGPIGDLEKILRSLAQRLGERRIQGPNMSGLSRWEQSGITRDWKPYDWGSARLEVQNTLSVVQKARTLLAHSIEHECL